MTLAKQALSALVAGTPITDAKVEGNVLTFHVDTIAFKGVLDGNQLKLTILVSHGGTFEMTMTRKGAPPAHAGGALILAGGGVNAPDIVQRFVDLARGPNAPIVVIPTAGDQGRLSITPEFLREVYATLRSSYDYVVIDTPPGFTPEVIASIDSSTHVCMVGTLDSLSLKNTALGLETLRLMGYSGERVSLVLNRADSRVGITREDVADVLGRPADVLVPSHRDVARSVNEGVPIVLSASRSEAGRAFASLAKLYVTAATSAKAPATNGHRRGRLRRRH